MIPTLQPTPKTTPTALPTESRLQAFHAEGAEEGEVAEVNLVLQTRSSALSLSSAPSA